jgi:hypothetical protein
LEKSVGVDVDGGGGDETLQELTVETSTTKSKPSIFLVRSSECIDKPPLRHLYTKMFFSIMKKATMVTEYFRITAAS